MDDLSGRLRYLRNAEALIAVALPAALVSHWISAGHPIAWPLRAAGLALVSVLLLQGALYWHLKHASVTSRTGLPPWFVPLYTALRRANLVAVAVVASWIAIAASTGTSRADVAWSAALLAFAVLEHVNYYRWQLMYDTGRDVRALWRRKALRRSALGAELRRARACAPERDPGADRAPSWPASEPRRGSRPPRGG